MKPARFAITDPQKTPVFQKHFDPSAGQILRRFGQCPKRAAFGENDAPMPIFVQPLLENTAAEVDGRPSTTCRMATHNSSSRMRAVLALLEAVWKRRRGVRPSFCEQKEAKNFDSLKHLALTEANPTEIRSFLLLFLKKKRFLAFPNSLLENHADVNARPIVRGKFGIP